MQNSLKRLSAVLFVILLLIETQAQNKLNVKEKAGLNSTYLLNNIRKLTFPSGSLTVYKSTGSSTSYVLNNLRYLNFSDLITEISPDLNKTVPDIKLYPNPVTEEIKIELNLPTNRTIHIVIINSFGSKVFECEKILQVNVPLQITGLSRLHEGVYVCRLTFESNVKSIKFVKF